MLMLSGCGASNLLPLPHGTSQATIAPYRITGGDSLEVRFYNAPELNIEVPVRSDGKISLELLGDVQAAGVEPDELSRTLTQRYARELSKPRVTVIVRSFGSKVYVDGEVETPAAVPFEPGMTTLQAISSAGGFLNTAHRSNVVLIRRVAGTYRGYQLALNKVTSAEDFSYNVPLQPSDILYVPMKKVSKVNLFVEQYIRNNLPVNMGLAIPVF